MIVTVRTELVTLLKLPGVLPEGLFALLADEGHVILSMERMVLRLLVAFGAVEPLAAAGRADGNLCVENVLADESQWSGLVCWFGRAWVAYHMLLGVMGPNAS